MMCFCVTCFYFSIFSTFVYYLNCVSLWYIKDNLCEIYTTINTKYLLDLSFTMENDPVKNGEPSASEWFFIIKAKFQLSNIQNKSTKFYTALAALPATLV